MSTEQGRQATLGTALRLEYLTVGWNVVEGLVAVAAAPMAGGIALLGVRQEEHSIRVVVPRLAF